MGIGSMEMGVKAMRRNEVFKGKRRVKKAIMNYNLESQNFNYVLPSEEVRT